MYISSRTYSREMAAGSVLPEQTSCGLVMIFSKMTSLVFSVLVGEEGYGEHGQKC